MQTMREFLSEIRYKRRTQLSSASVRDIISNEMALDYEAFVIDKLHHQTNTKQIKLKQRVTFPTQHNKRVVFSD